MSLKILKMFLKLAFVSMVLVAVSSCATTSSTIYLIKVERGDTLSSIAANYDTNWRSIAKLNKLSSKSSIHPGQILRVAPGPDGIVVGAGKTKKKSRGFLFGDSKSSDTASKSRRDKGFLYGSSSSLRWPLKGKVTSHYGRRGWRYHRGIDIKGARGTRIRATGAGKVIYSGWQRGFGKVVKIKHKNYTSLYAHCSRLYVKKGRWVEGGKTIAAVGSTGNSTGPHLHFEIQRGGKSVDPLPMLRRGALLSRNR